MPRIVGIELPKEKRIDVALTYIHGIGHPMARLILKNTNISGAVKAKSLTEDEVSRISTFIQKRLYAVHLGFYGFSGRPAGYLSQFDTRFKINGFIDILFK